MKTLSTILYSEVASEAMMAGREYCISSLPMELLPRARAESVDDCVLKMETGYKKGRYEKNRSGQCLVAGTGLEPVTFGL